MSRINPVDPSAATGAVKPLLDAVQSTLGATPNMFRVLAQSPKALEGFLGLYGAMSGFALDTATRERIALAVAESNGCGYCVAAHTALGCGAGLTNDETRLNRQGRSSDPRAAAIVAFAKALNDDVGDVSDAAFDAVRAAGISNREIVEIIATVALNIYTNVLNRAVHTDIDFPKVAPLTGERIAA
jgi:uncharacterized peroxidase-related enzyme